MKNLIIFALFLLIACSDEKLSDRHCFKVTFPDAGPLQFWLNDCDTYNQSVPSGVHYKCFCSPWSCDDVLKIPFTDSTDNDYWLRVLDSQGQEVHTEMFDRITIDVTPTVGTLDEGEDTGTGTDWTLGASPSVYLPNSIPANSKIYVIPISGADVDETIDFEIDLDFSVTGAGGAYGISPKIYIFNSDFTSSVQVDGGDPGFDQYIGPGNKIESHSLTANGFVPAWIGIRFEYNGGGGYNNTFEINSVTIENEPQYFSSYLAAIIPSDIGICDEQMSFEVFSQDSPETTHAKTDCQDAAENRVDPTVLIEYWSNKNENGLIFEGSPEVTFFLRIPAVFFHERNPQQDEVAVLSRKVIKLNGEMTSQRLLDTGRMPYWLHRKLQLVLMMPFVKIDGLYWTKQDAYTMIDGDKRWPERRAEVWLTKRDFLQRNVI